MNVNIQNATNEKHRRERSAFFIIACLICSSLFAASSTGKDVVRALYAAHQPFSPSEINPKHEINLGDKKQLSRFFDDALTALFLKENDCRIKSQEVCALDWDPFYNAQDGAADDARVTIQQSSPPPHLQYRVTTGHSKRKIRYSMAQTPVGWRITDIEDRQDDGKWLSIKKTLLAYR